MCEGAGGRVVLAQVRGFSVSVLSSRSDIVYERGAGCYPNPCTWQLFKWSHSPQLQGVKAARSVEFLNLGQEIYTGTAVGKLGW